MSVSDTIMHSTCLRGSAGALFVFFCLTSPATARSIVTTFSVSGADSTLPSGINASGTIAGTYHTTSSSGGFVRALGGKIQTFQVASAQYTYAEAINDAGTIVGAWTDNSGLSHGFLRSAKGKIVTFDVGTKGSTGACCINDAGTVAGGWTVAGGNGHGFLRAVDGKVTVFDVPTAASTDPDAISPEGAVTGVWYDASGNAHGFFRGPEGRIQTFDTKAPYTFPVGIDGHRDVAGTYNDTSGYHGFFRHANGKIETIDVPGAKWTVVASMNRGGGLAGSWTDADNGLHGFLRTRGGRYFLFKVENTDTATNAINFRDWVAGTYSRGAFLRQRHQP